ncbi:MAG TPA: SUMF1/EgtB/PvdO family nonheme iron enzyme [Niabella sp.]|nr:SUMF1/EgtB/PvdO family nonheme iron enzyme [Niabella sp.]HQX21687.1 SUMF1/EgtB/PvdO family nonheme iron enzyme [Niabella sp.]HQX42712.1 SUMF1/EgtB/PvdO family nonheme iron enzyme [Niabella sp.]HRB43844.1 SUMF1/EgtB/PvdO family nonheme iron enzyme [Niabella sp.]HRB48149.1 SUMF1/EgtB/PvdO family nonheme iron enzyme [Niabella sp.]
MRCVYIIFLLFFAFQSNAQQKALIKYDQAVPGASVKIKMIPIKGGAFSMGAGSANKATKEVIVSTFWMGAYEITHDIFDAYLQDEKTPAGSQVDAVTKPTPQYIDLSWGMGKSGGFPVNSMSQDGALMFCRWLYKKTGIFYRLPTEAEWEYACRAGSKSAYPFGNDVRLMSQYAWFKGNSENKYHKVGQKLPNAFGLYDMLGNVAEWTLDQYDANYFTRIANKSTDPVIPPASRYPRSTRGGSYLDDISKLSPSSRQHSEASWNKRDPQIPKSRWWLTDAMFVGFRIVRPAKQPTPKEANSFYNKYLNLK